MTYSLEKTRLDASRMVNCRSVEDVAVLVETPSYKLQLLSIHARYKSFKLPKQDGSFRLIEAPEPELKKVLRKLNDFLQAVYFQLLPDCVYGFVINPGSTSGARNIVSHAEQHLKSSYMLNADFEDFFHQITEERVCQIFSNPPFQMDTDTAALLSRLVARKHRLPMGSPTSPVLSNFACLEIDAIIQEHANKKGIKYTRFADDLTFSSVNQIPSSFFQELNQYCLSSELRFNPDKTKWMGSNDTKVVTGLVVDQEVVRIPDNFFDELSKDVKRMKHISHAKYLTLGKRKTKLFDEFSKHLEGKLQFVRLVYGADHQQYVKYRKRYLKSLEPKLSNQSVKWRDLPYTFFTSE